MGERQKQETTLEQTVQETEEEIKECGGKLSYIAKIIQICAQSNYKLELAGTKLKKSSLWLSRTLSTTLATN